MVFKVIALVVALCLAPWPSRAGTRHHRTQASNSPQQNVGPELRLVEVYQLIVAGNTQVALDHAERLVHEFPNFDLAQLVYGDLLQSRARPLTNFAAVTPEQLKAGKRTLSELKNEAQLRLNALRAPPSAGSIPSQFVQLSPQIQHAIAVDTSKSRLYLFENRPTGLTLIADYYVTVGKLGIDKTNEGDQRTPLGVYFITNFLHPRSLRPDYGVGALPINYPNALDTQRGKTGGGIWLHGTPPGQFSRPPKASDGCLVLSNLDMERIIRTVEVRTTPVVIAPRLKWVGIRHLRGLKLAFESRFNDWLKARNSGNPAILKSFYNHDVQPTVDTHTTLKDVSYLHWVDTDQIMVVTFEESKQRKRQYWIKRGEQWWIGYEGVSG